MTLKSEGRTEHVDHILYIPGQLSEISECRMVVDESVAREWCGGKQRRGSQRQSRGKRSGRGVECCSQEVEKGSSWSEGDSVDLKAAAQVIRELGRRKHAHFERIAIKDTSWWNQ